MDDEAVKFELEQIDKGIHAISNRITCLEYLAALMEARRVEILSYLNSKREEANRGDVELASEGRVPG